jgi:DNA-binding LytR/AlgR family response regulator
MLHVAVCDDCEMQLELIIALLNRYQAERPGIKVQTHSFISGEKVLESIARGNTFDLLLFDILMPEINGIELAKEIRKRDQDVTLIFLTASEKHALEAFGVLATQYIVKPLKADTLFPILDRVIQTPQREPEQQFILSMPERIVKLPFSQIVCVELQDRRLRVFMENEEVFTGKYLRQSFDAVVAPLMRDDRFYHAHKSFVVNLAHANELKSNSFVMKNNIIVPISRRIYVEAKKKYLSYHQTL